MDAVLADRHQFAFTYVPLPQVAKRAEEDATGHTLDAPRCKVALLDQRGDFIGLAQAAGANELNCNAVFGGHPFCVFPQCLA